MNEEWLFPEGSRNSMPRLIGIFENMPMVRVYDRDKLIYIQGERPECFYYLKHGRVRIYISSRDGEEKTISVVTDGAVLGQAAFFDGRARMSCASAVEKSELVTVNRGLLTDIIRKSPECALELLRLQADTIRVLSQELDSMAFRSADSRIASILLEMSRQSSEIRLTHEELSGLAGVSRVTVSRIISRLNAEGIIKSGYGKITVRDADALRDIE